MPSDDGFRVEKGVPVPYARPGPGEPPKYPWREMEPGDSFYVVAGGSRPLLVVQRNMQSSGHGWCKRNRPDLRCVTRQEGDGVRVWLVKREEAPDA